MIKKNRTQIILSSIVTLLPMFVGLILWDTLPGRMTTHWGVNGEADGFSSKAFSVFGLPLIMLAIQWICVLATTKDSANKDQNSKVVGMVLWIIPMTSLITNGMMYAVALGSAVSVDIWVRVLVGLMFVVLGNYLPKCKRNHTIGVKVSWALQNEENWNKTHRFTGRLWVLGGVILLVTVFVPMEEIMWLVLMVIMVLSFAPILYSYLYYRKQAKAGTATKEQPDVNTGGRKATIISLIISVPILIFVAVILFTGEITVEFAEESFTLDSAYWESMTVDYAEIDSIEYRESDSPGSRTYGFGSLKLNMGNFENEEFGAYTRYSYVGCEACIVLRSGDKVLVINGEDEESTKVLYEKLLSYKEIS